MSALVPIGIIAALLLLNAVYVAAEFAIVAARRTAIDERAAAGSRAAAHVARILSDRRLQDRYIATAQLGITLASLGLGMYGESKLAGWLIASVAGSGVPAWLASHAVAGIIAITVLTYFHIVLGEMVPKTIALTNADRAAIWLAPIMTASQLATYPLVAALNGLGNLLLWTLKLPRRAEDAGRYHTPEELQYIVRESGAGGLLRPEAADVLEELLEFGQLTAGEVMVPRVRIRGVTFGCTLGDLQETVTAAPHTRYPVFVGDLDHIVGTIHIKSVLRGMRRGNTITQSDIHPVPFIPETSTLDKVLVVMRQWHTQMAIVMDEHGGTAGLVTIEDLFEEVIGDIQEAGTTQRPDICREPDGDLRVAGTVRLDEVGEELDMPLEHDEVDTVSGLVLALLDRPPEVGDTVRYKHVQLQVRSVEGHGVAECQITVVPRAPTDSAEAEP